MRTIFGTRAEGQNDRTVEWTGGDWDEFIRVCVEGHEKPRCPERASFAATVKIDPPAPWVHRDLHPGLWKDETLSRRQTYDAILALGFSLDDGEKADFERWIAERELREGEEE